MPIINLAEKLSTFSECWQPRTVGEFNGHDLMVVKVKGEFVWHRHEDTDDLFLVLKGRVTIQLRSGNVILEPVDVRGAEGRRALSDGRGRSPHSSDRTDRYPNTGDRRTAAQRRAQVSRARGRSLTLEVLATLKPLDEKVPPIPRPEAEPVEL